MKGAQWGENWGEGHCYHRHPHNPHRMKEVKDHHNFILRMMMMLVTMMMMIPTMLKIEI